MRIAIVSDIHGNWDGLRVVLKDIARRKLRHVIALGDYVEGGDENDRVVEFLRSQPVLAVRGNHDESHDCELKPENRRWLKRLPHTLANDRLVFTHISPRTTPRGVKHAIEAWNVFDETAYRLCFVGHVHIPALFGERHDEAATARSYPVDEGVVALDASDRYVISFGAIGYPRAGGRFLRYGIFDTSRNTVEFVKLNGPLLPYGEFPPVFARNR